MRQTESFENPKIRIESDGVHTRIWIDGKEVEYATLIDFYFRHEAGEYLECVYEKYKTDDDGKFVLTDDKTEVVKEEHKVF